VDLVLRPGFTWSANGGRAGGVERSDALRGDGVAVSAAGVALRVDAFADDDDDDDDDDARLRSRSRETTTRRRAPPSSAASAGSSAFGSPRVVIPSRRVVRSYAARVADAAAFDLAPASRRKWRRVLGADERRARESGAAGATLRAEMDVSVAADDRVRARARSAAAAAVASANPTRGGGPEAVDLTRDGPPFEEEAALRVALAPLHLSLDQRVAAFLSGFFRGFGDASALEEEGYAVVDASGVFRSSSDTASSSEVSDADVEAPDASSSSSDAASSDRTGSSRVSPGGDGGATTFFSLVEVRAPSVRLEYLPRALNMDALVRGAYVEAINLVPFRAVPLTLAPVSLRGVRGGFAGALDATLRAWTSHVAETQTGALAAGLAPVGGAKNIGTKVREGLQAAAEHARRVARGAEGRARRRARERERREGEGGASREVRSVSREFRSVSRGVARLVAAVAEEALGLGAHVAAGVAAGAGAADARMRLRRDDPREEGARGRHSAARVGVGTEPSGVREGFRRAAETLRRGAADAAREVRAVRTDPRNPTVLGSIPRVAAPAVTAAATAARVAMLGARNAARKRGAESATAKTSVGMSERGERVSWDDEEEGEEEWGEGETRP
jgi:hypothetical protein